MKEMISRRDGKTILHFDKISINTEGHKAVIVFSLEGRDAYTQDVGSFEAGDIISIRGIDGEMELTAT